MAEESIFRGVLTFLDKLGVYDVILPFLLVFTIMFAILEKTKVLGLEKIEGTETTKKNLNSMVAFVTAFLVIASTKLVALINETIANVALLLILSVSFMILAGVFFGSKEFTLESYPGWTKFFMVLMFIGVVVIFLNALDWLQYALAIFVYWDAQWAATIILLAVIGGFMWYVVHEPNPKSKSKSE
ncbi:hypothetical protein HOC13_00760 [Candidatus Woesearchaeota archaeon]|jgi:hypothetical protein|nr:hypothetical protein [Candidatus Woesearchaeota archaeon]